MSLQEYLFTGSSKVTSCGFWQKRVRLSDLLEGGLTVLQEPTITVLFSGPSIFPGTYSMAAAQIFAENHRTLWRVPNPPGLVAQCSATPATVAATPPCSATPFQTTKFRCDTSRHTGGGGGATPKFLGGVARHRCYTCKTL